MIVWDNICQFCTKNDVVTPHLNRLVETVQIRGHNIWFQREIRKIIPQLPSNTPLIKTKFFFLTANPIWKLHNPGAQNESYKSCLTIKILRKTRHSTHTP